MKNGTTVFLVHGFMDTGVRTWILTMKNALLNTV